MFLGLFGSQVGVKLSEPDREQLLATGGEPFGPPERPMGGYVSLPGGAPEASASWVAQALDHVGALPPKVKKG